MTATTTYSDSAERLDALPVSGWHRRMTAIVGIGSFFDLYEVFLGGVLATVLAEQWGLGTTGKAMVIAAAFAGMFVGALAMSSLADRIGRRKVFMLNLASYSVLSIAAGFSPNLTVFVILRFLCGVGIGSELVLVDTYLAEFLPGRVRGRYISWAYVVGFLGVPLAALIGARVVAKHQILGLDGWRWLLIAGGLGAVFVFAARTLLPESPRWLESRGRYAEADAIVSDIERRSGAVRAARTEQPHTQPADAPVEARRVPLRVLLGVEYRRRTVMLAVFNVLQTVGYYGFGTLAPLVLKSKGYNVTDSLGFAALSFLGYPIGALVAVPIVERVERKFLIIVAAVLMALFGITFGVATNTAVIVSAGFLLTVSSNVFSNAYHVYQAEIFPTTVRSSAVGSCYSLSRLTSAVLPFIAVSALDHFHAGGVFAGSAVIMAVLCVDIGLFGPRTTGRSLEDVNERVAEVAAVR
ncbi:MFS transporter [Allobranchiibius sp. GilTou73]|uniref:MFS transporter n=1 Tax=Allobranchiibius sp. GilTou73 TaxID=2904523 RepID=UPI001F2517CB|nr:MFS transporter [Allobranchiibius sp. GilTou73]UIJ34829.1 MFS transporter [Allobranchiibius sp. GilTou73]